MRVVKTLAHIEALRSVRALERPLLSLIERDFLTLAAELGEPQPRKEFSLEEYGLLLVLEPGDDLADLREFGFPDGGLPATWPDAVDRLDIGGRPVYRVVVVHSDSYATSVYIEEPADDGTKEWLHSYLP